MHSDSSPVKPRVITVVKPGRQSLRKIKLLLNRRSVQTFEQLVADISEALGFPQWKNDRIRKLYSLKGKEIRSISDFFRGEEVFIAAGRNSLNLKVVQDVLAELYSDNPYAQNLIQQHWECSQKSNFKSFGKASKADSGFDETMIAKPRNGAKTPRQTAKNIENARTQAGQEGRARARKWERERWEKEQNKKRRGKEGNIGRDRSAEWGQEESLDEKGICEKCNEEQRFQKEFQTKKGKDVLSEKKENKMDRDHREHLQLEKRAKARSVRNLSFNPDDLDKKKEQDLKFQRSCKTDTSSTNDIIAQSRSGEEEVEDCYETEKEAHQGKEEEEREPTNNHNSVPKEMHASQSELLRSELGKLNSGVEEEAIRNSEMEMHRNEEPGQAKITKRLEKLRNEDTGQTVSREKLEMPRREGSGQTVSREKLEMPRHEGSGHAVSREELEMPRREGSGQNVSRKKLEMLRHEGSGHAVSREGLEMSRCEGSGQAVSRKKLEMHRREGPGQTVRREELEMHRCEGPAQAISRKKLEMPRCEGSGQSVSRKKLEIHQCEGSGQAASREELEMHRYEGPREAVNRERLEMLRNVEPRQAVSREKLEMQRCEEPGQIVGTERLEMLKNEEPRQTVSIERSKMHICEKLGQAENTERLEMPESKESGQIVSRKRSETLKQKASKDTLLVRPRRVQECHDLERYYKIGRTIGDGNFAIVKECRLLSTDCEYAMKIIDKSKLKGKEDMIENEISIIKSLSHPNIVSLIEEYESEKEIYLILEYVHGGDLFDAITESIKFTEHNAALMITDLCEALSYIHSINIVHRDLKPENLLVQRNADGSTTLKLADFGLGMTVTEPVFTVCGTPTYVAPEILSEKGYGLEVDMWASGVILYILLCGFPPFRSQERDQEELFEIIQLGEYEFLSPYWDNISDAAKDLITKLLVVDPKRRYTAQQVLQHPWIKSSGKINSKNLQREVTMNIERHFRNRRKREINSDQ
nr:PREDICTED: serine/threonine-protein kinase DCLK3 [Latimeria chalumnae]|eukprot:XP_014346021.1 PREDICTED: serine/threonine-protein kinase DCLK3 [Latimeria chalumnae]